MSTITILSTDWHILTGEYPPDGGGVADYTAQVAAALIDRGDAVTIWAPPTARDDALPAERATVRRLPDSFGHRGRALLAAQLPGTARLLVQYVPHAFGYKGMNVPFCRWLNKQSRRGKRIDVMFHEVAYPVEAGQPASHRLLAHVNRYMARQVALAADRIFVSTPTWNPLLQSLGIDKPTVFIPTPSNVRAIPTPQAIAAVRAPLAGKTLLGHFGTYGDQIAALLKPLLVAVLTAHPQCVALLIGRRGKVFADELAAGYPSIAPQLIATGSLDEPALAAHLAACDVLLQPFPDGVTARRSTLMAGLQLGRAIVTPRGPRTEEFWPSSGAIALAESPAAADMLHELDRVLADPVLTRSIEERAAQLYRDRFDLHWTIDALRANLS